MKDLIFERIKANQDFYLADYLPKIIPGGHWEGDRYVAGSIEGGKGNSFSFSLRRAVGADFATDERGKDIIDIGVELWGLSKLETAKKISSDWGLNDNMTLKSAKPIKKKPEYKPVYPVPAGEELTITSWWTDHKGEILGRWAYRNQRNEVLGWVVRFKDPSAKAVPFQWCGKDGWQSVGFTEPRPLYNLQKISEKGTILIVEGEKCADAASLLFPALIALTWQGGSNAVKKTDWTPLANRGVIIWRDNDLPGKKAEDQAANILSDLGCRIRIFKDNAFEEKPSGWDVADMLAEGAMAGQKALDWLKNSIHEYRRGGADVAPSQDSNKSANTIEKPLNPYYKCLGQVGNKYYFYNYSSGQVSHVSHDGLNEMFLLTLSNGMRGYWETTPGERPDYKAHAGALMAYCHNSGQFDIGGVRGRGTWEDQERYVTNTGDGLIIDNKKMAMSDFDSEFVYLRSKKLNQNITNRLNHDELQELLRIIEGLRWEDKICAKLLAGWLIAAPVCGALPWRSHIYISGPAGSGKSWLYDNIISRALKPVSMRVSSKTTEAGIRHALGPDALPVIFDEAEAESVKDAERMQGIMDLARQASSPDGAPILKGTASQEGAKTFYIRSSFCFLSIMPSIRQYADETRITILTLKHRDGADAEIAKAKFKNLSRDAAILLKGDFGDRLVSYSGHVVKSMRENFQILADIGTIVFGNKRVADQLAMLLAGYYAYSSDGIITEEEATKLLEQYNWQSVIPSKESNNQARLLTRISQFPIEVQVKTDPNKRFTRSIGEIIEFLSNLKEPDREVFESFASGDADAALRRRGIRYDEITKTVLIANNSEFLKTILANSPWSTNWAQALKAIDGSQAEKTIAFGGFYSRAMSIPVLTFLDTSDIK